MTLRHASVFSQLLSLISRQDSSRFVRETGAEKGAKESPAGAICGDDVSPVAQAKSLRDIDSGLRSCEGKLKHLGLSEAPGCLTLAYANAHRPWELFEQVFHSVLAKAQREAPAKKLRFKNKLYSMDSTVIELCASMFDGDTAPPRAR